MLTSQNRTKKYKVMDFRTLIDPDKLEKQEVSFLEEIITPELAKYTPKQQGIILNRFRAVVENRSRYVSVFPADKEYDRELIKAEGVRKIADPADMARQLVLGIISRKEHLRLQSFQYYQPEVLDTIRTSIRPEKIFTRVNGQLKGNPTHEKASVILDVLTDSSIQNNSRLINIADFLKQGLAEPSSFNKYKSLVARLNKRTIDLSRSHGRFGCCAFWGTGEQNLEYQLDLGSRYHTSVLYLADPEIGLLFNHIEDKEGQKGLPAGAVIMASMLSRNPEESESREEKTLLIDSVEAYRPDWDSRFPDNPLRKMKNNIWRRVNYNSIFMAAQDIGATRLFYNPDFWNDGGNTFTNYFLNRARSEGRSLKKQSLHLRKPGARKYIPSYYHEPFGFLLDCIIPHDRKHYKGVHAIKGNHNGKGIAKGWAIDLR